MNHKRWLLLVAAGAAAGACAGCQGAAAGCDEAAGPAPTLSIGSSDRGFVPLAEGGTVATYKGPQGGYHVFLNLRVTGMAPGTSSESPRFCEEPGAFENPCVSFDVFDLDDGPGEGRQLDNFTPLRLPLTETGPGIYDLVPPRLITVGISSLDAIDGHRCRITASVEDAFCRRVAAELTVTCAAVR